MNPLPTLIFTSTLVLATLANTFSRPTNIEARHVVLYTLSSTSMPDQTFPVNFQQTFTATPTFAFGINQYKMGDKFFIQNFNSQQASLSNSQVNIQVTSVGSTNPQLFSISFIAVESQPNIAASYFSYTSATNISSGSGSRFFEVFLSYNFPSNNSQILPFLTGFYITTGTFFNILIEANYHSSVSYQVKISTSSDCVIHRTDFYVLILLEDALTSKYFYVAGQNVIYSTSLDINSASWTTTLNNYSSTQFVLGVRGFDGFAVLSNTQWGWSLTNVNSDVATLTIDKIQLQHLYFSFLQIGAYPTTTAAAQQQASGGSIGIIAGLIVAIVAVAVIVFVLCRWWKKTAVVYNTPEDDKMKEMPTISL